jgi:hypothetical protein
MHSVIIYPPNYNPWRILVYFSFIPVCLLLNALLRRFGLLYPRCPKCHRIVTKHDELRRVPTPVSSGLGVKIWECEACGWRREKEYSILPSANYTGPADPRFRPGGIMRHYIVGATNLPGFNDPYAKENSETLTRPGGRIAGAIILLVGLLLIPLFSGTVGLSILAAALPLMLLGIALVARTDKQREIPDPIYERKPWWIAEKPGEKSDLDKDNTKTR